LYGQLGVPCVPVAHNSGLFWEPFLMKSGTVTVEFLPAILPGLDRNSFMARLENSIETAAGRLTEHAAP
jgi:1-acyl-sn-glycerol-3-phosphate acyltransferase